MLRAYDYEDIFDLPSPSPPDAEPALDAASAVTALLDALAETEEGALDEAIDAAWDDVVPSHERRVDRSSTARL